MNIGELSKFCGIDPKLIRHYETVGLIPKPKRSDSGYRIYEAKDAEALRFLKRARELGFSLKEAKKLLDLWSNTCRTSAEVKLLTQTHIQELEKKIENLQKMVLILNSIVRICHGDSRSDCPILEGIHKQQE